MYDSGFLCREQTQEIQLSPFESYDLGTMTWDFSLSDDSFIPEVHNRYNPHKNWHKYVHQSEFLWNIAPNQYLDLEIDISSIEGEGAFSNDNWFC